MLLRGLVRGTRRVGRAVPPVNNHGFCLWDGPLHGLLDCVSLLAWRVTVRAQAIRGLVERAATVPALATCLALVIAETHRDAFFQSHLAQVRRDTATKSASRGTPRQARTTRRQVE